MNTKLITVIAAGMLAITPVAGADAHQNNGLVWGVIGAVAGAAVVASTIAPPQPQQGYYVVYAQQPTYTVVPPVVYTYPPPVIYVRPGYGYRYYNNRQSGMYR